jgi:predicted exporter
MKPYHEQFVAASYDFWAKRRWLLISLSALVLCAAGLIMATTRVGNDISSMLPDKDPQFRKDFELFSYAPFSRNILISLEESDEQQGSSERLTAAADKITESLKGPYFTDSMSGINQEQKLRLFNWMYDRLPCLFTEQDVKNLEGKIAPAAMTAQLQDNIKVLGSPESVVLKKLILKDPLAIRGLLLGKLKQLSVVQGFSADSDYFLSTDGKRLLIIAETPVAMTDYAGGRKMLDELYGALKGAVPAGMKYRVICGHRYTVANAETIQKDLLRVFAVSIGGLVAVAAIFLPAWRALVVFLIPMAAFLVGAGVVGAVYGRISGITLGFGSVLLGITSDYALYVFYGFQEDGVDPKSVVKELARPMTYCALMAIGVFAVLLLSALPGQRELAVFSIAGLVAALLAALIVQPHLMRNRKVVRLYDISIPRSPAWIRGFWIVFIIACIIPALGVRFDANLRSVGMIPQDVLADEMAVKKAWGGVREQAMVFAIAGTSEEALQKNDMALEWMRKKMPDAQFISLGSILPSMKVQQENLARWNRFWHGSDRKAEMARTLEGEGKKLGFNTSAFEPFLRWLDEPAAGFTLDEFQKDCDDKLIAPFVTTLRDGQAAVLSFIPDDDKITESLLASGLNVKIISNRQFSKQLDREIAREFPLFLSGAAAIVLVLLFLMFRDARKMTLAFLPVVAGLIIMPAVMTLCGMKLNLFNMVAASLVIGLVVDYGIFVVSTCDQPASKKVRNAVLLSGLTTVIGFGALIVARHPALNSIGTTVTAGVVPAMVCALTLLPALASSVLRGKKET